MSTSTMLPNCLRRMAAVVPLLLLTAGCGDRPPGQVCATRFEVERYSPMFCGCKHVNLIFVVDKSSAMGPIQDSLAAGLSDLVGFLTNPDPDDPELDFYPLSYYSIHVLTSDLGLVSGDGVTCETEVSSCEGNGDKAESLMDTDCLDEVGQLSSIFMDDSGEVSLVVDAAQCLVRPGTDGCDVNQSLSVLSHAFQNKNFDYDFSWSVTAVIVVSDKDDCSIASSELFQIPEWQAESGANLAAACHFPESNEAYLATPLDFAARTVTSVHEPIFAAFVGVPGGEDSPCQGTGEELLASGCLSDERMKRRLIIDRASDGSESSEISPVCAGYSVDGTTPVSATPGRRFVEVAEHFGDKGLVASVCESDWGPAMKRLAGVIGRQASQHCWPRREAWSLLSKTEREAIGCLDCGVPSCNVTFEFYRYGDDMDDETCPAILYENLDDSERAYYESLRQVNIEKREGVVISKHVLCVLPKLPAPLDCDKAAEYVRERYPGIPGWYYCESKENNWDACHDEIDNDGDGFVDCYDGECAGCESCGGDGLTCPWGCAQLVDTNETRLIHGGFWLGMACLKPPASQAGCEEHNEISCNDGEDNDGNGAYDCDDTSRDPDAERPHLPDPACCPMTMDGDGQCAVVPDAIAEVCGETDWRKVEACFAHQEMLGCR